MTVFSQVATVTLTLAVMLIFSILTIRGAIGAPFVPTPLRAVKKMIAAAKLKKGDKIYDIGCGDGRILFLAEKEGADAVGFEISPLVYLLAIIKKIFKRSKAKIFLRDFENYSLKDADVIFCYLMPHLLKKIREKFQRELKKETRIISYAFHIPEWEPVEKIEKQPELNIAPIWIYETSAQAPKEKNNTKQSR